MNILVVSEHFIRGGLETHINTYYDLIDKRKNKVIFAFSKYEDNGYLKNASIYTDFNFNYNSSVHDFLLDVKRLVDIINENDIDVIQIHPFYSLFPALFAANITNTKVVYTYHGYSSINFIQGMLDSLLFLFGIEYQINKIFCVSNNVFDNFIDYHNSNVIFLPNIIDEDIYNEHQVVLNKKWALVSRIDYYKYSSIVKFLKILPELDIDQVDVYGSGDYVDKLLVFLKENNLCKKVHLKGFVSDISKQINEYTGTIGIGRVTIESLCMNYPSILIGYNKVIGVITPQIYDKLKSINFVPSALEDISVETFNMCLKQINSGELSKYQFRKKIIEDFGKKNVNKYIEELKNIEPVSLSVVNEIFDCLNLIDNKELSFYNSIEIFNIVSSKLSFFSRNLNSKIFSTIFSCNQSLITRQGDLENEFNQLRDDYVKLHDILLKKEDEINALSKENLDYKIGKLYRLSTKIYSLKSKLFKKRK